AVEVLADSCDLVPLLHKRLCVKAPCNSGRLAVVGEGAVFISPLLAGARHCLDRMGAIAPRTVHLEVATDVVELDESGQCPLLRRLYLPPILAQLRWDPHHANGAEDLLFRLAANPFACFRVRVRGLLGATVLAWKSGR